MRWFRNYTVYMSFSLSHSVLSSYIRWEIYFSCWYFISLNLITVFASIFHIRPSKENWHTICNRRSLQSQRIHNTYPHAFERNGSSFESTSAPCVVRCAHSVMVLYSIEITYKMNGYTSWTHKLGKLKCTLMFRKILCFYSTFARVCW